MRNYGGQAMNRIYETKDGRFIVLAGSEAKFCENLLRALGRLDFLDIAKGEPGRVAAAADRILHRDVQDRKPAPNGKRSSNRSICAGRRCAR